MAFRGLGSPRGNDSPLPPETLPPPAGGASEPKAEKHRPVSIPKEVLLFLAHWFHSKQLEKFAELFFGEPKDEEDAEGPAPSKYGKSTTDVDDFLRRAGEPEPDDSDLVDRIVNALDVDQDGDFDLEDVEADFAADIEGPAEEDMFIYWPIFIGVQCVVASALWLGYAFKEGTGGWARRVAGLENLFDDQTILRFHMDCTSLQPQIWRWWTYQYTHGGVTHILMNVFLTVVAGAPLEMFEGHLKVLFIFYMGVIAGAWGHAFAYIHDPLVGMSGGCYALLGMLWADLVLNWRSIRYRVPRLLVLLILMGMDVLNVFLTVRSQPGSSAPASFGAHFGGFAAGFPLGVVVGKNIKIERYERTVKILLGLLFVGLSAMCMVWVFMWPPRTVFYPYPWCWARQIYNNTLFNDTTYHCVLCPDSGCASSWQVERWTKPLDWHLCDRPFTYFTDGELPLFQGNRPS